MIPLAFGHRLPPFLAAPLFGDRRRFGLVVRTEDPCWSEWVRIMPRVYDATQRVSVGAVVNAAGYAVVAGMNLEGRSVLEVGPADMPHLGLWRGIPAAYALADIRTDLLDRASARLREAGMPWSTHRIESRAGARLPFAAGAFDVVVSFYCLEHLHPLAEYLAEIVRVLRPGGLLVGAIPCEGGLGWGLGRYLTSRRWIKRHSTVDPDKIICWEHPNFADAILRALDGRMIRKVLGFWPMGIPSVDLNLVARFVYRKRHDSEPENDP